MTVPLSRPRDVESEPEQAIRSPARRRRSPLSHYWLLAYFVPLPVTIYLVNPGSFADGSIPPLTLRMTLLHTLTIGCTAHALLEWVVGPWLQRLRPWAMPLAFLLITQASVIIGLVIALPVASQIVPLEERSLLWTWFQSSVYAIAYGGFALTAETLWKRAKTHAARADQEKAARRRAEERALQARTSAHFLFNALNTLAGLVREDPEAAEEMTLGMARIMRYSLSGASEPRVPLHRELAAVRDYLSIESVRFGDRIHWEIAVDESARGALVPPMSVQPLVENAILHGIAGGRKTGAVRIAAMRQRGRLRITICDDGPGPGQSSHRGSGTNLRELAARLELLYGDDARVALRPAPGAAEGCEASLDIPFEPVRGRSPCER